MKRDAILMLNEIRKVIRCQLYGIVLVLEKATWTKMRHFEIALQLFIFAI